MQRTEKIAQAALRVFDADLEIGDKKRVDSFEMRVERAEPDQVFAGCDEAVSTGFLVKSAQEFNVGEGESMVIAEGVLGDEAHTLILETGKKLVRTGDATEGQDGRARWSKQMVGNGHLATEPDDRLGKLKVAELIHAGRISFGNGKEGGSAKGGDGFAKIASGKKMIVEIVRIHEDDVGLTGELAMLEAIVQEMHAGGDPCFSRDLFCKNSGLVPLSGYVDWNSGFACDLEGLVSEKCWIAVWNDPGGCGDLATITPGEHVCINPSFGQKPG